MYRATGAVPRLKSEIAIPSHACGDAFVKRLRKRHPDRSLRKPMPATFRIVSSCPRR
jgi:hypothetical protein